MVGVSGGESYMFRCDAWLSDKEGDRKTFKILTADKSHAVKTGRESSRDNRDMVDGRARSRSPRGRQDTVGEYCILSLS